MRKRKPASIKLGKRVRTPPNPKNKPRLEWTSEDYEAHIDAVFKAVEQEGLKKARESPPPKPKIVIPICYYPECACARPFVCDPHPRKVRRW
jgi:hypothetical protein